MNNLATIEKIDRIYPHENADALECAEVRNCQVIVPKDKYKEGDKIVFIWPDSVLPDKPWAEFYKKRSNRVKATKIRSLWSFGIVENIETVAEGQNIFDVLIGTEISNLIGVTKYETPPPKDLKAKGGLPYGIPKTDEENYYKFDILPYGELCTVTTKIDGSSFSCYYHLPNKQFGCMSRSLELKTECLNSFTEHLTQYDIENKLREYCETHGVSLCVRGESHGNGRNGHKANNDAKKTTAWAIYSVWDIENHRYINIDEKHNFVDVANALSIPHVPILDKDIVLSRELVEKYVNDDSGIEGVVIHCKGHTFKIISLPYDSKK